MNLWQDIRYGERMLRKSPGFAITAVLTLALGIGVTTSVFSVVDSLLWKPIALPHLESLVMVEQRIPGAPNEWNSSSPADLDDIRHESTALENFATWDGGMANIVDTGGEPERAMAQQRDHQFVLAVRCLADPVHARASAQPGE